MHRPASTAFKQQTLPAWRPIMTAGTVLPTFFAVGIIFIPLGITLLMASKGVQEYSLDYTSEACMYPGVGMPCSDFLAKNPGRVCSCGIEIKIENEFLGNVFVYYGLSNYYQNHRRYVKSRDDQQLAGASKLTANSLAEECEPFRGKFDSSHPQGIPYAPCGTIANSLFNDTYSLSLLNGTQLIPVGLFKSGIAWSSDLKWKFRNPPDGFDNTLHPPNWQRNVDELDDKRSGYKNEDLIVWMRTAALPKFKKFHRKINHTGIFATGLPSGTYILNITYAYPVTAFGGRKHFILTTTSWLGGKNSFLGTAYIAVGGGSLAVGIYFLISHIRSGRHPMDLIEDLSYA